MPWLRCWTTRLLADGIADTRLTWFDILTIVAGILAVVLNGSLLIAMVRNRSTIFTSKGAYLVANLALADLLTGLNSPLWCLKNAFQLPQFLTTATYSIFYTSFVASFFTIFIMSLERYIAIVFPFKAQILLSKARTIKSCVTAWLIAALCYACKFFFHEIASFCVTIIFEITIFVTMFFYYKIAIKLRQRRKFMASMQPHGAQGRRANADLQRDYQLLIVVFAITFIFIIAALPYMVAGNIFLVRRLFTAANDDPKLELFYRYYLPVQLMNFVVNPIVYAWRLPNYRLALLRTLRGRWRHGALVPRTNGANPALKFNSF